MKFGVTLVFLLFAAQCQAQTMKMYCEAEMQAQDAAQLTPEQRSALSYYKAFNKNGSGRYSVGADLTRRHLDSNQGGPQTDDSPVSACLLKALADDSGENPTAPLAQEAYALRLLEGKGVPRNKELALQYLQRSARWDYSSAATHIALIYLADANNPASKAKAISWLDIASFKGLSKDGVGGWSAGPERPIDMLFKIYTASKDWKAAEDLYRRARDAKYPKDDLAVQLLRIPGLKSRIDAEDLAYAEAVEERRRAAAASRPTRRSCVTYRNGFQDCRYY